VNLRGNEPTGELELRTMIEWRPSFDRYSDLVNHATLQHNRRNWITWTLRNARRGKLATLGIRISHHGLHYNQSQFRRLRLKCDGTRAETRFRLSARRTSPFKSAGASVQSTAGSRVVRISGSNAGYTMFRGSVKSTGYPLHSPVSTSLPLPCVTVCHHISTGLYQNQELVEGCEHCTTTRLAVM
jgi:hypothetical protein